MKGSREDAWSEIKGKTKFCNPGFVNYVFVSSQFQLYKNVNAQSFLQANKNSISEYEHNDQFVLLY